MPSPKKLCDWVVASQGLAIMCERCGAVEYPPTMPISVTEYVRWAKAFFKKHRNCKEPA